MSLNYYYSLIKGDGFMKRFLSIILTIAMMTVFVPCTNATTIIDSGMCGDNATWELDSNGTLTISGIGEMKDYLSYEISSNAPWRDYLFTKVIIESGIKNISKNSFFVGLDCKTSLTEVEIQNGVNIIDEWAFSCIGDDKESQLKKLYLPNSITSIESCAFYGCSNISDVYYDGTREQWNKININNDENGNSTLLNANIHFKEIINNPQITSATASKSGSTYAFSVGLSDVAADCQLVTALYSGGEMVGVKSTQLSEGDTSKSVSITTNNATSAKVFIWDSLTGMRPLCDAKIVTIQ